MEASAHVRIAEHNDIIASLPADSLLKQILSRDNLNGAYKKVKSNRGTGGVDRMSVDELLPYLREHRLDSFSKYGMGNISPSQSVGLKYPKRKKGNSGN